MGRGDDESLPPPCGEGQAGGAGQGGGQAARYAPVTRTDHRQLRRAAFVRSREIRRALTPQEARLWAWLKGLRTQGLQFRRQAPFRGYFHDFVCFSRRLVIEVDGGQHGASEQAQHDRVRDAVLAREGFTTLRVWNADINTGFEGVCETIWRTLNRASPPPWPAAPAYPSPQGGGRSDDHD